MANPDSWNLLGAFLPSTPKQAQCYAGVNAMACETLRGMVPGLLRELSCMAKDPSRVLDLDGEVIDNPKGIKAIQDLLDYIESRCDEDELAIFAPDTCEDDPCRW